MLDELVKGFLVESHAALQELDTDLLTMEKGQQTATTLDRAFRALHTIKGTSGFLGFSKLGDLVHEGECWLDEMRSGERAVTPEAVASLFGVVDSVRDLLAVIGQCGSDDPEAGPREDSWAAFMAEQGPGETASATRTEPEGAGDLMESTLRVDVGVLDSLMNLIGELVLTRNELQQLLATSTESHLLRASQRLSLVTAELQQGIMRARMQPISRVWDAMPRLVRDLAITCSKPAHLVQDGRETELDKTLLEAIRDPLTHLVRNAVDHGLEKAEDRLAASKPAEGRIGLRACHEGGQVIIEISDDGGGIDPAAIRAMGIERGLVTTEQAEQLSDVEAIQLIFHPGFSTAAEVTTISGRGVGMDVVKTNIERVGGTVEIRSKLGQGTVVRLRIPLTLAIMPSLIVLAGGESYALPQVNLVELVYLQGERARRSIEFIHDAPVFRRRGALLPLVALNQVLGLGQFILDADTATLNIVVLQTGGRRFGLIVDDVADAEDIVVKPLGAELRSMPVYAGATIMGNGRAALIIDVLGLAQLAGTISEQAEEAVRPAADLQGEVLGQEQQLLLFATPGDGRMAVPLDRITRLEEFASGRIERVGGQEMIQHRESILPLVRVSNVLPERRLTPRHETGEPAVVAETLPVFVHARPSGPVGISVGAVLDVVSASLQDLRPSQRDCVAGSLVIQDRITEILDVDRLLSRTDEISGKVAP